MRPRSGERGKELVTLGKRGPLVASMRPRSGERGKLSGVCIGFLSSEGFNEAAFRGTRKGASSWASSSRSRRFNEAAFRGTRKVQDARPVRPRRRASMRPRSGERGKPTPPPLSSRRWRCFNEAAFRGTRKGPRRMRHRRRRWCFNEAAFRGTRKVFDGLYQLAADHPASMRPRSGERGKGGSIDLAEGLHGASMRPRSGERGKSRASPERRATNRSFNEAAFRGTRKGAQDGIAASYTRGASMRPRSGERGKAQVNTCIVRLCGSFNEAAFRGTRKGPW